MTQKSTAFEASEEKLIEGIIRDTLDYFFEQVDDDTGLIADSTAKDSPASVAAVGLGVSVYVVAANRSLITREDALARCLKVAKFFKESHQGREVHATGYQGFYYHFLHMSTGERVWESELSTIDTALLLAGLMLASEYFSNDSENEKEFREVVKFLFDRVNWQWALNGGFTVSHGWKPETGFLSNRWSEGYSEAHIIYAMALGSTTHPISERGYFEFTQAFPVREYYGIRYIYAGPLFIHQLSQIWLDLRGIQDDFTRNLGWDYFENSRRATEVQQKYAIANPHGFKHYGRHVWGITASDGPGPAERMVDGVKKVFYNYVARGAPDDLDDGTISPWVVASALPFTPACVLDSIRAAIKRFDLDGGDKIHGYAMSVNPTFPEHTPGKQAWISPNKFAINQGPVILMAENYQSGLLWDLMRKNEILQNGLRRAGFRPSESP